jgi:hypothetical protein
MRTRRTCGFCRRTGMNHDGLDTRVGAHNASCPSVRDPDGATSTAGATDVVTAGTNHPLAWIGLGRLRDVRPEAGEPGRGLIGGKRP